MAAKLLAAAPVVAHRAFARAAHRHLPDLVTGETWIDWRWRGHRFSAHSIYGDFLFFSENPDCPETLLRTLAEYLAAQIPPDIPQIKSGG